MELDGVEETWTWKTLLHGRSSPSLSRARLCIQNTSIPPRDFSCPPRALLDHLWSRNIGRKWVRSIVPFRVFS